MAKKMKKPKPVKKRAVKRRQDWCQMVIRVRVPLEHVKAGMKLWSVRGALPGVTGHVHSLEPLSAYYDLPGQPNACS